MALRNRISINLVWIRFDLTNSTRANNLITAATAKMIPGTTISVTRNVANTEAIVKITATETEFRAAISTTIQAAILQVYTEGASHDLAVDLVATPAWTAPRSP